MKMFLLFIATILLATQPVHEWSGLLKECANKTLHKAKDYNFTQEELNKITKFDCEYSGEIYIEPLQDLTNIKVLRLRESDTVSEPFIRFDKSNNTTIVIDENDTGFSKILFDKMSRMFFDVNQSVSYDINNSHALPEWIGNFSHLEELYMSGCHLSGFIPDEIGNLTTLKILDLSGNQITRLPTSIGNLTSLKELHLSSNKIVQKLPVELGNLSSLERLYLQNNKFFGEIPPEIGDDFMLKKLRLNQNNLKGEIPHSIIDLNLSQQNGLGLHQNCNLYRNFPDCNASDANDAVDCNELNASIEVMNYIDEKSSLYRGFNGIKQTSGNCFTPVMVPIIMYLLSDTNQS